MWLALPSCVSTSQIYSWQRILLSSVTLGKLQKHWLIWIERQSWVMRGAWRGKSACLEWCLGRRKHSRSSDSAPEPLEISFPLPAGGLPTRDNKDFASPARHRRDYSMIRNSTSEDLVERDKTGKQQSWDPKTKHLNLEKPFCGSCYCFKSGAQDGNWSDSGVTGKEIMDSW